MAIVFLMLGSNLDDRLSYLMKAGKAIADESGPILRSSAIYESEPWGFSHPVNFYNQILVLQSRYKAEEILKKILAIEQDMGRIRNNNYYEARIIDIDIIFYDNQIIKTDSLTVPHPKIAERRFVLLPLLELNPDLVNPVSGLTIWQMYRECGDKLSVKRLRN